MTNTTENRINEVINQVEANGEAITVDNVITQSLFSPGGTLAGKEDEVKKAIMERKYKAIEIVSYNIHGQVLRSGKMYFDVENSKIITNNGRKLAVINDYEFTYKVNRQKKTIQAAGGIEGLLKFITEINTEKSPFNPCYTDIFIEL